MIIDRFPLSGIDAYVRDSADLINLADTAGGPYRLKAGGAHRVLDIDSIDLLFSAADLPSLFARQDNVLVEVITSKELFPALLSDPYARRILTVGGGEDFRRGPMEGFRVLEVEGRPTLVTEGTGTSRWTSPLYSFENPVQLTDAAWDLAVSRVTPQAAFTYSVRLDVREAGGATVSTVNLVQGATATDARQAAVSYPRRIAELRAVFEAQAVRESEIQELHHAETSDLPLGIPLLSALHLLELRTSQMEFHSLHEVNASSTEFTLYGRGDGPLTMGTARLNYRAALTGDEQIQIKVAAGQFSRFEARVSATLVERPPIVHR